jgi:hypothetical protein
MCAAICAKSPKRGTCPKLGCGALNPASQQQGSVLNGRNLLEPRIPGRGLMNSSLTFRLPALAVPAEGGQTSKAPAASLAVNSETLDEP